MSNRPDSQSPSREQVTYKAIKACVVRGTGRCRSIDFSIAQRATLKVIASIEESDVIAVILAPLERWRRTGAPPVQTKPALRSRG
jgi:hypothetical protein